MTRYSQNDEEDVILAYFAEHPPARFLDIGAHDGVTLSNTRALAERGWCGTLVEPSADAFRKLMDTYRDHTNVNLANLAVVPPPARILKFHDSRGDFVSTFSEQHRELWSTQVKFQPIYVAATTVALLLLSLPGPYEFINLDVEGINAELFGELPLRALGTKMVCVEYQDRLAEIEARAAAQGYARCHLTSENAIFVEK